MKRIRIKITENRKGSVDEGCGCPDLEKDSTENMMADGHTGEEARMHRTSLAQLHANSLQLLDMIEDNDDLPEWVESKITKAADYISSVRNYINGNVAREQGALEE